MPAHLVPALAHLADLLAEPAEMGERALHRLAVVVEMGAALVGDGVEPLVALGGRGHVAGLFEEGQRRIDDAGARAVHAAGLFLDGLDQIVAVARLLLDEIQRNQAQIARGEHAADPHIVAKATPVAEIGAPGAAPRPAPAAAAAHGLEFAPHAVLGAIPPVLGPAKRIIMMHDVSPIYLTIVRRYACTTKPSRYIA